MAGDTLLVSCVDSYGYALHTPPLSASRSRFFGEFDAAGSLEMAREAGSKSRMIEGSTLRRRR
jgi:hypothetical protein